MRMDRMGRGRSSVRDHVSDSFDFLVELLVGDLNASIGDALQGFHRAFEGFEASAHFLFDLFQVGHGFLVLLIVPLVDRRFHGLEVERCDEQRENKHRPVLHPCFDSSRPPFVCSSLRERPSCVRTDE